ncbi:MAG: chromate transporter [Clostridia bacterium]|nr:chromate transporter [Clostridia bacterium]
MEFLRLFWVFFKIGLFTIGGGHAMIPLIMQDVVAEGWLTEEILIDFIAISESTPGPFAVNIATYTGTTVGQTLLNGGFWPGLLGALCATIGVVSPSLIIIILIVKLFSKAKKKPVVKEVFTGVRSSVAGLLLRVFVSLFLTVIMGMSSVWDKSTGFDFIGFIIFAILLAISFVKIKGKSVHPIIIVVLSGVLGLLMYGFIPGA